MTNTRVLLPEGKLPDLLLATIGDFGRWQCRTSILMALLKLPIAWFQLGIVFLAPPTEFWCRQPEDFKHLTKEKWKETIRPLNMDVNNLSISCYMKNVEYHGEMGNRTVACKWGYEYDKDVMRSNIISEWDFVCGKEFYADFVQISFMSGVLIGTFIFGLLADRYGRKKILMICIILQFIFGILSAISPIYSLFLATRFVLALANGGTVIISFVLCMEVVSGKWRTIVPILYQIPFGIGNTIMALLAYFIKEWRELQLVLSSLSAVFLVYIWFLPESPRWLVATGRKEEAVKTLQKALKFNKANGKNISDILDNYTTSKKLTPKFSSVFRTVELRKRTFFLALQWLFTGITFHAFMQYVGQLGKNLFLNVSLGGLVTIPGAILCILIIQKVGRKWTIACSQILTSICLIIIYFIPLNTFFWDWPRIMFAGAVIITLSIATNTLFLFTGELYPTIIRNAGVGSCVVFFKVGAIIAPLILSLLTIASYLPLLIMSLLALLQALVIYPLPESKDCQLPESITDIEMKSLKKDQQRSDEPHQQKLCTGDEDNNCNIIS